MPVRAHLIAGSVSRELPCAQVLDDLPSDLHQYASKMFLKTTGGEVDRISPWPNDSGKYFIIFPAKTVPVGMSRLRSLGARGREKGCLCLCEIGVSSDLNHLFCWLLV